VDVGFIPYNSNLQQLECRMPQPTPYERGHSFTDWSAQHPADPQPGADLDAEFDNIELTLDQILTNLALIQRDDGDLANSSVGLDQLDPTEISSAAAQDAAIAAAASAASAAANAALLSQAIGIMTGPAGKSLLNGIVDPGAGVGANGDMYINSATQKLFGPKAAGAWPAGVNLKGTNGAAGAAGANGTNGIDGNRLLTGSGAPAGGTGTNGDLYVDTATGLLYGPKALGVWGTGVAMYPTVVTLQAEIDAVQVTANAALPATSAPATLNFVASNTSAVASTIIPLAAGAGSYKLRIRNIEPVTDGSVLMLRVSTDGGATFRAGATDYNYAAMQVNSAAASAFPSSDGLPQIALGPAQTNSANYGSILDLTINTDGVSDTQISWEYTCAAQTTLKDTTVRGGGRVVGIVNLITHVLIQFATGNIAKYKLSLTKEAGL
jgi:hypothetical protein